MKQKAVFLDRDGTIIKEVDLLRNISQLRLLPNAGKAIKKINLLGYLVIIITNQPVIARGWVTEQDIDYAHFVLLERLKRAGARVQGVYYCPHHPNANLKKYRIRCACRKPNIGMIKKAFRIFNIDPKKSFIVGDRTEDMLAGKRAGLKSILVKTGYGGRDKKYPVAADFQAKNLYRAADIIKKYGS